MADDLTADDLSRAKLAEAVRLLTGAVRDWSASDTEIRAAVLVDDLMDQGWRLASPPDPTEEPLPPFACGVTRPHQPHLHPIGKHDVEVWCCGVTPPQSGTVTELDLIVFLEWLDSTRQVTEWGDPGATHEDTAREYLAQAAPSGNVTVSADDLRSVLWDGYGGGEHWQEARRRVVAAAGRALAETARDH